MWLRERYRSDHCGQRKMNMELDKLVETLTRLVLAEVEEMKPAKTALVFSAKKQGIPGSVRNLLGDNWQVVYPVDVFEYSDIDRFILPEMKIDQMVNLALGKSGLQWLSMVRKVLLSGRKVEVIEFEYRKYPESGPQALISLYEEYYQRLLSFGIIEAVGDKSKTETTLLNGLITEKDVQRMWENNIRCLELGKKCQLTPLAQDFAREHRMSLISKQGETG